jgi:hypothetical protein
MPLSEYERQVLPFNLHVEMVPEDDDGRGDEFTPSYL